MQILFLALVTLVSLSPGCKSRNSSPSEVKDSRPIEKAWLDDSVSKIESLKIKSTDLTSVAINAQSDYSQGAATAIRAQTDALVQMAAELELYLRAQVTGTGQTVDVPVETEVRGGIQIIGLRPILTEIKRIRANIARDLESNLGKISASNNTIRNAGLGVFISATTTLTTDLTKLEADIRTWYSADGSGGGGGVTYCSNLPGFLRAGNGCVKEVSYNESTNCYSYCRSIPNAQGHLSGVQISANQSELTTICESLLSSTEPHNFLRYLRGSVGPPLVCVWSDRSSRDQVSRFCACEVQNDSMHISCSDCYAGGVGSTYIYDVLYNGQHHSTEYYDSQNLLGWPAPGNCTGARHSDSRCR